MLVLFFLLNVAEEHVGLLIGDDKSTELTATVRGSNKLCSDWKDKTASSTLACHRVHQISDVNFF